MLTYSETVKEEVTHLEFNTDCKKAILSAFLSNVLQMSIVNNNVVWYIDSHFSSISRFITTILNEIYHLEHELSYSELNNFYKKRTYRLIIKDQRFEKILEELSVFDETHRNVVNSNETKRAFLVGAFLSGGSISDINKSIYHLEIRSNKITYLRFIQTLLSDFSISITLLKRRYTNVLYIKKANDISDFLKIIGATNSMQKLEDVIISRDFNNQIHRLNNLDISNMTKTVNSANEQVKMINAIKNSKEYNEQKNKFKFFCELRLTNPTSSLQELSELYFEKYNIKISRTGINHHIIKLKQIYRNLLEKSAK